MTKIYMGLAKLAAILLCCITMNTSAQIYQAGFAYQSNYYLKQQAYNPAFAGFRDLPNFLVSAQFQNHYDLQKPRAYYAAWQQNFASIKSGLGLNFQYYDQNDAYSTRQMMGEFQYAFTFQKNEKISTRVGLGMGFVHYYTAMTNSPGINQPIGQAIYDRKNKFNANIGLLMQSRRFYLGFGMHHTNQPSFDYSDVISTYINPNSGDVINYNPQTTFVRKGNMTIGYTFSIGERLKLTPNAIAQGYFSQISYGFNRNRIKTDVGVHLNYNDLILAGISYKANDPIFILGINAGIKLASTYFITANYDLPKKSIAGKHHSIEIGFGLFFGESGNEFEEETAPEQLQEF